MDIFNSSIFLVKMVKSGSNVNGPRIHDYDTALKLHLETRRSTEGIGDYVCLVRGSASRRVLALLERLQYESGWLSIIHDDEACCTLILLWRDHCQ